jgi:4-amino-4-deoxy-L-arabinose transferase-like glycosyltransferase
MLKSNHPFINYCITFVFAVLTLYPLVAFIDALPIYLWDESRQAANAIEMYTNHNWIVTYFDGAPDMWNTKPPLLIWLQVLCMNIMGCTVMALRMPSVIAAFATTLSLFFFIKKETGNIWIAFFSGIALVSMEGFNGFHVARTGDYDALLILFVMLALFQFYYYLDTFNKKHILLVCLFLGLGSLTKGIAALLFLPGILAYALIQQKVLRILKAPYFYVGCLIYILLVGGYYVTRESANPGYLNAVYMNELGGRFLEVNEGHEGNMFTYFILLSEDQTYFWFNWFLVLLILCPFFIKTSKHKKLFQYFLLLTICFITIITVSKTKITWYVAPALPLIACMSILLLFNFFEFVMQKLKRTIAYEKGLIILVVSIITVTGYVHIARLNDHPKYNHHWERELYRLSSFVHKPAYPIETLNLKIINHTEMKQLLLFYVKQLQLTNPAIDFGNYKELKKGDDVLVADETINTYIKANYTTQELYNKDNVYIYSIK